MFIYVLWLDFFLFKNIIHPLQNIIQCQKLRLIAIAVGSILTALYPNLNKTNKKK